jgi:hypothetical protein
LICTCDASNANAMDGSATLATERLRFATAATRIRVARTIFPGPEFLVCAEFLTILSTLNFDYLSLDNVWIEQGKYHT